MSYAVATDGVRLHYEVLGRKSAPPVLMIQGLGADKHLWDLQRLVLATRYRVIAHDNRGAGRSDKPFGAYSLEQMAHDAMAVLDHAGVENAHIVGASMGGAITQVVGLMYPERTRSLALVCTSCSNHQWRRDLLASWSEIATKQGMGEMTAQAARWVIGPRSLRRLWPAVGWMGPIATARASHGFNGQVRAILDADDSLRDALGSIRVPTAVIVGNQDVLTPRGDSEELAELIPTAELTVLSGAAHGLMVEHATTFNRVLGDFLGRANRAWETRQAEANTVRHLRSVPSAS
ncbi:MAG: alpha/beta fold hydrolase [Ilumatobacteraceae bacterium]